MHIVFERSNGPIRSNCNILALAWMPYYNESIFRRSHLTYQQRLLAHLTEPFGYQLPLEPANEVPPPASDDINRRGLQEIMRRRPELNHIRPAAARDCDLEHLIKARAFNNSRLIEQVQRFVHASQRANRRANNCDDLNGASNTAINDYIDALYGKMDSFGWLAIGNIGKMIGVTLTSTTDPPTEVDGRLESSSATNRSGEVDLIDLSETTGEQPDLASSKQAQANDEPFRPDRKRARTNFNLRGHLDEVILVKWNEIYQKLASVDSKGNVMIWSKSNDKFTIQTPFYNKSKSVADFKWSNDGKTALICYTDSFILVGSSSSQRHWHSMLNLDDYHITCATWTPNDEQLLLGVSNGNIILIDLPTSELTELAVGQANIRTMCWSSSELNLRHLSRAGSSSSLPTLHNQRSESTVENQFGHSLSHDNRADLRRQQQNVVNRRRLSLNCAMFCRYRPSSLAHGSPSGHSTDQHTRRPANATKQRASGANAENHSYNHREILAIDFADNSIKLFNGGLGDPKPQHIQVQLESYLMAWSSDGRILAVGGFNIYTSAPSVGCLRCKYLNAIKFYNQEGKLIRERRIKFTRYPITALTWAHDDRRLFVATGPRLHCAKVFMGMPQLSLLSLACLYDNTKLMNKSDALMGLVKRQLVPRVLNWQSHNCPIEIDSAAFRHQQQQLAEFSTDASAAKASLLQQSVFSGAPQEAESSNGKGDDGAGTSTSSCDQQQAHLMNNVNIVNYQLPAKLKSKIDQLFSQTTRQPYDDQFTLADIVWHVPKNQQRLHCTLVCYTHELLDAAGCLGYQYKIQDSLQPKGATGQQRGKASASSPIQADVQFKIFVLYVEFQGSLVPILKARRIGFLKPEFVLFDPEPKCNGSLQRYYKVSDIYQSSDTDRLGINSNPCAELHGASYMGNLSPHLTRRQPSAASKIRDPMARFQANPKRIVRDPHLLYLLNLSQQQRQSSSGRDKRSASSASNELVQKHELMRAIERQRLRSLRAKLSGSSAISGHQQTLSCGQSSLMGAHETSELIRIKSNIWGTKFKLINMSSTTAERRAILGSVHYKASLLHLQPRQIHLSMKDMSNYCVLCSVHHHTKMQTQKRTQTMPTGQSLVGPKTTGNANATLVSLLDSPQAPPDLLPGSSSGRPSRSRRKLDRELVRSDGGDKLLLAVGDTIRVAPQLEANQKYKLVERSSSLCSAPSVESRHRPSFARLPNGLPSYQRRDLTLESGQSAQEPGSAASSRRFQNGGEQQAVPNDDDILTVSIDQGERFHLEMSSESHKLPQDDQPGRSDSKQTRSNVDEQKISDFLRSNKTLKSIQTITSMIVDLSAKAQEDDVQRSQIVTTASTEPIGESSPLKLLKIEDTSGASQRSPSRSHYIPPETPVHRPRRLAAHSKRGLQAQSATSSPLTIRRGRSEVSHMQMASRCLNPDDPLPPPPPAVPFRRRLSISAKRLIDGSLRSLSSLGVSGIQSSSYLTGDEADTEECESLVQPRRHRQTEKRTRFNGDRELANRHRSQPCSPLRSGFVSSRQPIDLAALRSQVVEKLRLSSSWMSPAKGPTENLSTRKRANSRHDQGSVSCTKRSNWVLKESRDPTPASSSKRSTRQSLLSSSNSSSSSDVSSISSLSSTSSSGTSDNEHEPGSSVDGDFSFLNEATRKKLFKRSSQLSSSVKEFGRLSGAGPNSRGTVRCQRAKQSPKDNRARSRSRRRVGRGSKSICSSHNCCCAREFKLGNRPPVWNELSQVYQLDFGGRVTQESAKNLQFDFNGNLALQFGRIDNCTYTLDYQFPFNAVQAMSIALASLTQRLK